MITPSFATINPGYNNTFKPERLTFGLTMPMEAYAVGAVPEMARHVERVQLAEASGFDAVWVRDVPFNVPSFGDPGHVFDPFAYLGFLAAKTERIALITASIVLPIRHPAHVAKAAVSLDVLSGGRLVLGVASGDRPEEYPATNNSFEDRGDRFRDSFDYMRQMPEVAPSFNNHYGSLNEGRFHGIDMLPKPVGRRMPMLVTGSSRQSPDWIAEHSDGWITFPRNTSQQAQVIADWRTQVAEKSEFAKPIMQPLYVDLADNDDEPPSPIHLGFRSGVTFLCAYLKSQQEIGVNHIGINLRFNRADTEATIQRLAAEVLPEFRD